MASIHHFTYSSDEFEIDGVSLAVAKPIELDLSIEVDGDSLSDVRLDNATSTECGTLSYRGGMKPLPTFMWQALETWVAYNQPKLRQYFLDNAELPAISREELFA